MHYTFGGTVYSIIYSLDEAKSQSCVFPIKGVINKRRSSFIKDQMVSLTPSLISNFILISDNKPILSAGESCRKLSQECHEEADNISDMLL